VVTLEQPPKEQPLPKKQLPHGNHKGVPLRKKLGRYPFFHFPIKNIGVWWAKSVNIQQQN